jgi:lysophospholipase L1-like esterase
MRARNKEVEHGITPVLLTAPSSHRRGAEPPHLAERYVNDLRDMVPLHQAYAAAVRAVAAQTDTPLVDLYAEFNRLPEEELNKLFESDGVHLTEAGDRKIAASLYQHLARYGLIERLIKKD